MASCAFENPRIMMHIKLKAGQTQYINIIFEQFSQVAKRGNVGCVVVWHLRSILVFLMLEVLKGK